ncbi:hypothetical protein PIB30_088507 [Stylosanthes scabra]|uniref:DUF4283 domain-containing protein n=1 Tax=Stylosanthes scabra TaxID=79078 RepID=A0ABU6ZSZ6_9FABA|nr:hypothetical protein [Stylosanthes scabra]
MEHERKRSHDEQRREDESSTGNLNTQNQQMRTQKSYKEAVLTDVNKANRDNIEWLQRSLVGETLMPYNYNELKGKVICDWDSMERASMLGSMKLLMVFNSVESMEEAFNSPQLWNHFLEVRKWSSGEANSSRRAWIEVIGLLLHGWSEENIRRIGEGPMIQALVDVFIEGEAFRILVREIGSMNTYQVGKLVQMGVVDENDGEARNKMEDEGMEQDGNMDNGGHEGEAGEDERLEEEFETSRVEETQMMRVQEAGQTEDWVDNRQVIVGSSIDNPTKTQTWDIDRMTEEVIRERVQVNQTNPIGPELEVDSDEAQVLVDDPDSKAPPGFDTILAKERCLQKGKAKARVERKEKVESSKRKKKRTTIKLKEILADKARRVTRASTKKIRKVESITKHNTEGERVSSEDEIEEAGDEEIGRT